MITTATVIAYAGVVIFCLGVIILVYALLEDDGADALGAWLTLLGAVIICIGLELGIWTMLSQHVDEPPASRPDEVSWQAKAPLAGARSWS